MHQLLVRSVRPSVVPAAFSDYRGFLDDSSLILSFSMGRKARKSLGGEGGTLSVRRPTRDLQKVFRGDVKDNKVKWRMQSEINLSYRS